IVISEIRTKVIINLTGLQQCVGGFIYLAVEVGVNLETQTMHYIGSLLDGIVVNILHPSQCEVLSSKVGRFKSCSIELTCAHYHFIHAEAYRKSQAFYSVEGIFDHTLEEVAELLAFKDDIFTCAWNPHNTPN